LICTSFSVHHLLLQWATRYRTKKGKDDFLNKT
jgi:hypothetical protein